MKRYIFLIIVALLLAFIVPPVLPKAWISFFVIFVVHAVMAQFFSLLTDYSGMLTLGFHGLVGFGGYVVAMATTNWRLPYIVGIILAGIMCFMLSLATSFLISRMRGLYFAMGTLVMASVLFYWFQSWPYAGGGYGMPLVASPSLTELYYISLLLIVTATLVVYFLLKGETGLRIKAIADDDMASESYGINVFRTKLYCWMISAFFAGLAGALYFLYANFISPESAFSFYWTLAAIIAGVLGGRRTIPGPIIGAFIITWLRQYFLIMFPGLSMLIYGILLIVVLMFLPKGIVGYLKTHLRAYGEVTYKAYPKKPFTPFIFRRGSWGKAFPHPNKRENPNRSPPTLEHPSNEVMRLFARKEGDYGSDTRHPPIALTPTEGGSAASGSILKRLTIRKSPKRPTILQN